MSLLKPAPFPFDFDQWKTEPFHIRTKMLCQAWALQGFGAPPTVILFYVLKIFFFIGMWVWFASFSNDLGSIGTIGGWWSDPEALVKAIAWSMLFEGLGLASGSGPLTGRYVPPFGGFLYYLRPGTIKIPFIPGMPFFGGDRRRLIDCILYLLHVLQLVRVLVAPEVAATPSILLPTVVLLPLMGLTDRAMFMTSRPEHYLIGLTCFLFPGDALAASKWVWFGIWFWAATSKLNRHFPSVISVMLSNSGMLPTNFVRDKLFCNYPDDLRPSKLAGWMAHMGTATEYAFPTVLMLGFLFADNVWFDLASPSTLIALIVMLGFHSFITLNVPMGVPVEWNVMMVYGGFVLFGAHAAVSPFAIQSGLLVVLLLLALLVVPLMGNLFPAWISFLLGMRFYAGNWKYSVWLFRDDAELKIADHVTTTSPVLPNQLGMLYDAKTVEAVLSRVQSFRLMHMHGRVLHDLIPKAVDDIDRYTWRDGELICGVVVGWNFGDGHLHNQHLLRSLQARCQWKSGDVRVIFVDPQPIFRPHLDWQIWDARDGELEHGRTMVDDLVDRQPYPMEPVNV
jgi:hypothetical protein